MPGAVPLPRSPSVLLLGDAAGLLTAPGCPACRYTAESSDTYLSWFALEGHGDPDVLQGLGASRGMCARHTRRLIGQPGAASRLTAVYRYVVAAVTRDPGADPAGCPACDQEAAAEDRVLGTLLDDLAGGDRSEYKTHGGLCLPHLRRTARRARNLDVRWMIRFMIARLCSAEPGPDVLAGAADPDAHFRAGLRGAARSAPPAGACPACWAAAARERALLAEARASGTGGRGTLAAAGLCRQHLRDAASGVLLAWQADVAAGRLAAVLDGKPRLLGIAPGWLSARARRALADPDCAVCTGSERAAADELRLVSSAPRDGATRQHRPQPSSAQLCTRHVARLRAVDAAAGRRAVTELAERARHLVSQLDADFGTRIRESRVSGAGPGVTAWRRAAVFLDGSVLGGWPADLA
jgi:hypothetical protein